MRRERLVRVVEALQRGGIEMALGDGSPIDLSDSPGIEAKVRLRRAPNVPAQQGTEFGYEVLAKMPSGGMAECFKIRDQQGQVRFLKKVPTTGLNADALLRELGIYDKLERASAAHVLRVIEHQRSDSHLGLVTEFAEGGTLDEHKEQYGDLPSEAAKSIALSVLAGLSELHSLDIVHRDLKPQNVLRAGDQWKLADFGISKNLARLFTRERTFQRQGTRGYTPPEQWEGREANPSADVYAFGKLVTWLLTGSTDIDYLFENPGWARIVRQCTNLDPDLRPSVANLKTAISEV